MDDSNLVLFFHFNEGNNIFHPSPFICRIFEKRWRLSWKMLSNHSWLDGSMEEQMCGQPRPFWHSASHRWDNNRPTTSSRLLITSIPSTTSWTHFFWFWIGKDFPRLWQKVCFMIISWTLANIYTDTQNRAFQMIHNKNVLFGVERMKSRLLGLEILIDSS